MAVIDRTVIWKHRFRLVGLGDHHDFFPHRRPVGWILVVEPDDGVIRRTGLFRTATDQDRFDDHHEIGMAIVFAFFRYEFEF